MPGAEDAMEGCPPVLRLSPDWYPVVGGTPATWELCSLSGHGAGFPQAHVVACMRAVVPVAAGELVSAVKACCDITVTEAAAVIQWLCSHSFLVACTSEACDPRAAWSAQGWGTAYEFASELAAVLSQTRDPVRWSACAPAPVSPAEGRLVDPRFPPPATFTGRLDVECLARLFKGAVSDANCRTLRPNGFAYVADHTQGEVGWWNITRATPARLSSAPLTRDVLTEIAPLAYGRAGFAPDALVLLAHDAYPGDLTPGPYATLHVEAGTILLGLEVAASRHGMSFMCHYGVTAKAHEALSLTTDDTWLIGAIGLGASR